MSPFAESLGYQIVPDGANVRLLEQSEQFFNAPIYTERWIQDCVSEGRFLEPSLQYKVPDVKGLKKIPDLLKKKTGYTQLEILAIYDEIQRIKTDPQNYKYKGNLASRALWAKVEQIGNI